MTLVVISIRKSLSFFRLIDFPRTASYDDLARVGPSVGFAILELGGNPRVNDRFCTLFYHHRSLERLDLSQTWITDDGVHNLVWMRRLRSLDLSSTGVTDGSLAMLVGMPSLAELDVSGTRCTAKGIKAFAKQRQEE